MAKTQHANNIINQANTMPEKRTKPPYALAIQAIKRNAETINNSLTNEMRNALIEQEHVIEESKAITDNAIEKSRLIVQDLFRI